MAFQTQILFEEPGKYKPGEYPYLGASPKFVNFLKAFLIKNCDKIVSVKLALYLFNNYELHKTFLKLAKNKIKVDVFSIPLEGYDNSLPQTILPADDGSEFSGKQTKRSLANLICKDLSGSASEYYRLFVFPHAYIRSPRIKPFSRGKVPYSLHTKSLLIELKDNQTLLGISSSNLAVRDLPKHDYFVIKPVNSKEEKTAKDFFKRLSQYSEPISKKIEEESLYHFPIKRQQVKINSDVFFISPFYINSPELAEKVITDFINSAKKRIWLMAQHISSFRYKVPLNWRIKKQTNAVQTRDGFLTSLLGKGKQGIDVRCLSQTYVDEKSRIKQFREPVNKYYFRQFINEFKKNPRSKYAVNDNIHSKFIIVDNMVIATTFNFTPTQFISLPYVKIDKFENIPGLKYSGVFSEVGQLLILRSKMEVDCFEKNFNYVWNDEETQITIGN